MANHRQRRRILSVSECYSSDCSPLPPPPSPPWSSPSPSPTPPPTPEMSPNYSPPIMSSPDKVFKNDHKSSKSITLIVVLFLCALALAFLFLTYLTVRKQRNSRGRISRRRRRPSSEEMENRVNLDLDLLDDNQGPVLDHPIWYIRTVGLQQSVIDSITIFKYKRGERLIEGADCSVCLSEFEEDETLRLLPKCSHAFHIHCIDTWLSSHQNCPLCRAPIVSPVSVTDVPNSTVFTISDQAQSDDASTVNPDPESLVNSHSQPLDHMFPDDNMRLAVDQFSVEEEDEDRVSGVSDQKDFPQGRNNRTRVLSDIGDHRRSVLKEEEDGSESVGRRSVSMDALSAAHLTSSFLAMVKADGEGCSSTEPAAASSSSLKNSSKKKMRSNSLVMDDGASRVTKTYSFGRFLQRGPPVHAANLKRSTSSASSSGGFFPLSSRH